jgi:hypothetical protein
MGKRTQNGKCHICGSTGNLSFEHVPPESAFNDKPVILKPFEGGKGKIQQRGMGAYTLCELCNNNTGSWYGANFVKFCHMGMEILQKSKGNPKLIYLYQLYPLRIIKQIITMMFSANSEIFADKHSDLVRFVLDKERKYLSPRYRFWLYYNNVGEPRFSGIMARANFNNGSSIIFSEITYPPFGYVMTLENSEKRNDPPDDRLIEISDFVRYGYNEFDYREIKAFPLPTHLEFPGDYRTSEEIYKDFVKSKEYTQNKVM